MKTQKGFTLIELLVVIAIIGILSSVVLASLNTARVKARDARRVSDLKQLQIALEMYFDANSSYPVQTTYALLTSSNALITPGFMSVMPADPLSAQAYGYVGTATGYCLGARLEGTIPAGISPCTAQVTTPAANWKVSN